MPSMKRMVLDDLVQNSTKVGDAQATVRAREETIATLQATIKVMQADAANLRKDRDFYASKNAIAERDAKEALPRLTTLWNAADAAHKAMTAKSSKERPAALSALRLALSASMIACGVDDIPF